MSTRINYKTDTAWGGAVAEAIGNLMELKAEMGRIEAAFDAMAQGGSFERIELEVGGMTAGDGKTLYNLIAGSKADLDRASFGELARLDQG